MGAKEFAEQAMRNANLTPDALRWLRQRLELSEHHTSCDISENRASVRRLRRFIQELPHPLSAPPSDERRIRWACDPVSMAMLGCTALQLFAVAAAQLADEASDTQPAKGDKCVTNS